MQLYSKYLVLYFYSKSWLLGFEWAENSDPDFYFTVRHPLANFLDKSAFDILKTLLTDSLDYKIENQFTITQKFLNEFLQ